MEYIKAKKIADDLVSQLSPHCYRCEIAGSIRRMKPEVKDIEIVAIPKPFDTGLFESGIASVVNQWEKVKGEIDLDCRYTQRVLPEGIKLDLFLCKPDNWGNIFAMRTGSADYSHRVLAARWVQLGYRSFDGYLYGRSEKIALYEEKDLYQLLSLPYLNPEDRK